MQFCGRIRYSTGALESGNLELWDSTHSISMSLLSLSFLCVFFISPQVLKGLELYPVVVRARATDSALRDNSS